MRLSLRCQGLSCSSVTSHLCQMLTSLQADVQHVNGPSTSWKCCNISDQDKAHRQVQLEINTWIEPPLVRLSTLILYLRSLYLSWCGRSSQVHEIRIGQEKGERVRDASFHSSTVERAASQGFHPLSEAMLATVLSDHHLPFKLSPFQVIGYSYVHVFICSIAGVLSELVA